MRVWCDVLAFSFLRLVTLHVLCLVPALRFDVLDPVTRAILFSVFMHSLHRGTPKGPLPRLWTLALQTLERNPRREHTSDLPSVAEESAKEQEPLGRREGQKRPSEPEYTVPSTTDISRLRM